MCINLFFATQVVGQVYVNVHATGTNDGSSWENAYVDLQQAMMQASPGSQLWIANGIYQADNSIGPEHAYFHMTKNLKLYGGFSGNEPNLEDRDWVANKTVLSADYNDDDVEGDFDANRSDNGIHVMVIDSNVLSMAEVDGLVFKGGHTKSIVSSTTEHLGGGVLALGSPRITNCSFLDNYGYYGGAIYGTGPHK